MDVGDLQTLGQVLGAIAAGGWAAWKLNRTDRQTKNTGNGFAQEVREAFGSLEDRLERIERRIEANNRRIDRVEDKVDVAEGARVQDILDRRRRRANG